MRATDLVGGPFTPPGFYYKTFIRPRRLWPLYEKVLRHAAGLGKLRKSQPEREWRTEYRRRHADVLVDRRRRRRAERRRGRGRAGRRRRARATRAPSRAGGCSPRAACEYARELAERARDAGVEILDERARARRLRRPRAGLAGRHAPPGPRRRIVYATGAIEQPLLFPGQRPAGRDALGRRAPARSRCTRSQPGRARRGRDGRRPRARGRARAASTPASSWPAWPTCASTAAPARPAR